ncbi:MAG: NAD(P)-binding protein [Egibacteraceae bacterium]
MDVADEVADVVVLGGGLAGLSLALQLRRAAPGLSVVVAERRAYRPRSAAFKVGESTSEVGAHYFANVLGLGEYLREAQVRKNGLRFFFSAGGNLDIAERVEFSTPLHPQIATYQLDRGLLENTLWDRNRAEGSVVLRGCRVEDVELSADGHRVSLLQGAPLRDQPSGRAGVLGVVDPAGVGADQHRGVRGPAVPPVRADRVAGGVRGLVG